ncbi:MAG: FadR family transcriptional regulator [Rhodobacteraceae bacterium]|uniref:FadR/GntR family transcriptional regulator n=1 Tax=Albidovulum sp. TaxID=1872424 RepID=UPI001DBAF598|nr:FadR family transcriptional regulator [Paracoccaceae bacterium]HPE27229.1 FCD domain-containing protein [Albidovulum sp.]HRX74362.1 FCD domain-containing protein [Hyphomonas sp.]MCB2138129.1 FadR family transcriptional regulator [Paracoccaceae bacterium]MCB2144454.1 FadR family transcriptional regulator [Paracoccaceae bacterium]
MTTRLVPYQSAEPPEAPIGATVQTVIDTLFARIEAKEYEVDERLPSERTLAAELGVARNTVREALDVLETRRVIRRRAGSGSFVTYQSEVGRNSAPSALASNTSPLHHLVVRGILEPEIVRLAIINMTPRQIDLLGETLSQMEQIRTDATAFASQEEELYRQIAHGTGNPLLAACYELTIDACRQNFRSALLRRYLTPKRISDYQQRYNTLFNAIAARDIEAAVEFIKLHLVEEQRLLLQEA